MSFLAWTALAGLVLLGMGLASEHIRRLPVSTASIYLGLGLGLSPLGLGILSVEFTSGSVWLEHLTELAVAVSLFIGGLNLRLSLRHPAWKAAFWLAGPVMVVTILGVAGVVHFGLGLSWGMALLLGAMLAPTDPVLASAVTVNDAQDHDRMRYGLSGEAGFNDGMAFPFVLFALLYEQHGGWGDWVGPFFLSRVLYAVPVGLLLGYLLGRGVGLLTIEIRHRLREREAPNDFLAMALIALSFASAEAIGAYGFLATFAAGLGLRRAEKRTVEKHPIEQNAESHPPAEQVAADEHHPGHAAGRLVSNILSFGDTLERLLEILLVALVGTAVALAWDWRAVGLALALFLVIRPLAVLTLLGGTPTSGVQRGLMGWLGLRGIGTLYYLAYALNHDPTGQVPAVVGITLSLVAISVVVHGMSATPLLSYYERSLQAPEEGGAESTGRCKKASDLVFTKSSSRPTPPPASYSTSS